MQERAGPIAGYNRRGPMEALDPHAEEQDKKMGRIQANQDNVQRAHRAGVVDLTVAKEVMHLSERIPKKWSGEEMKQRAAWRDLHGSIKDFRIAVERQMFGQDGGAIYCSVGPLTDPSELLERIDRQTFSARSVKIQSSWCVQTSRKR